MRCDELIVGNRPTLAASFRRAYAVGACGIWNAPVDRGACARYCRLRRVDSIRLAVDVRRATQKEVRESVQRDLYGDVRVRMLQRPRGHGISSRQGSGALADVYGKPMALLHISCLLTDHLRPASSRS